MITHSPLVHALAWVILNADHSVFKDGAAEILNSYEEKRQVVTLGFGAPRESLEEALDSSAASMYAESSSSSSANTNKESSKFLNNVLLIFCLMSFHL